MDDGMPGQWDRWLMVWLTQYDGLKQTLNAKREVN